MPYPLIANKLDHGVLRCRHGVVYGCGTYSILLMYMVVWGAFIRGVQETKNGPFLGQLNENENHKYVRGNSFEKLWQDQNFCAIPTPGSHKSPPQLIVGPYSL